MQNIFAKFSTKPSLKVFMLFVLVVGTLGFFFPRSSQVLRAENCSNAAKTPTLNPFPLTFDDTTSECKDYPLVMMKKVNNGKYPKSISELNSGITASAGEELFVTVYIHNGAATNLPESQTLAKDVSLISVVPNTVGTTRQIQIRANAANAQSILQNYTVTTGANERLEVVPNSGERFNYNGQIMESGFAMGNNELAIGSLKACFEYSRFYRFRVKVVTATSSQLSLTKEVRNLTANRAFAKTDTAQQNEILEYRIKLASANSTAITNATLTDTLNSQLELVTNSLSVNGQYTGTSLTSGGLKFATLNQTGVEVKYQTKVLSSSGTITNTASVSAENATSLQDTATVTVNSTPSNTTTLSINKEVRNLTKNIGFQKNTDADNGNQLEYRIRITNTGSQTARNVILTDSLNNTGISPVAGLNVDRSYTGSLTSGLNLGDLAPNATITVSYLANVIRDFMTVTNTASTNAINANTIQSSAVVNVSNQAKGNLNISKQVRQLNSTFQKSVTVQNNEIVEYRIIVGATSNNLNNVSVAEVLPAGISYVTGTLRVDNNPAGDNFANVSLGSLSASQTRAITFQARVTGLDAQSNPSLTNIAIARADGVSQVQDSAVVSIQSQVQTGLTFSKRAFNITKNQDATTGPASRGDSIIYTLTVSNNTGSPVSNFVITDDLSGVMPFVDMTDNNGGVVSGNVITFSAVNIPAGASVSKAFEVKIKESLAPNLTFTMTNVYGNTVNIQIQTPTPVAPVTSPKTGGAANALVFGGITASVYGLWMARKNILGFLLA